MTSTGHAKVIDINSLVSLRKHFSWASPLTVTLGLVVFVPFGTLGTLKTLQVQVGRKFQMSHSRHLRR